MPTPTADSFDDHDRFQPVAGLFAFLLPGAGHFYLGQRRRGLLIFAGVFFLFLGGLFIGGIDAVDSGLAYQNQARAFFARITGNPPPPPMTAEDGDPVWFLGQAFAGPVAFIADHLHQFKFKVVLNDPRSPNSGAETYRDARPDESRNPTTGAPEAGGPPNERALGRIGEIGTLYCTIAGMMNLICIIDASYNRRRRGGGDDHEEEPSPPGQPGSAVAGGGVAP